MSPYDAKTFEEFWPFYVRLHTRPVTQWMHALASVACVTLLTVGVLERSAVALVAAPLADYVIAQVSHRLFEANKTTPWKRQTWHTRAELRMLRLVLTGRMRAEVERLA